MSGRGAGRRRVGVLALQGGVVEHQRMLETIGAQPVPVRRAGDLDDLDAIVLPGGESSTMDRLLRLFDLRGPLAERIAGGLPTLGTCAGLVLLARRITDPAPGQQSLGILDITVRRNAFGPQLVSEEATLALRFDTQEAPCAPIPLRAAFIRAPEVTDVGAGVGVLGRHRGRIVAVRQGSVVAVACHPELAGDATLHRLLLGPVRVSRLDRPAPRRSTSPAESRNRRPAPVSAAAGCGTAH